jgi:hypothetical protein
MTFEHLTQLKNNALQTNNIHSVTVAENLGRQFVRIMLDRQDKELVSVTVCICVFVMFKYSF